MMINSGFKKYSALALTHYGKIDRITGIGRVLSMLQKKNYNSIFERPSYNMISHLHVIGTIDTIKYLKVSLDLNWSLSIMLTSAMIRLLQIPMHWLIKVN